jgi:alpha-mannosidase
MHKWKIHLLHHTHFDIGYTHTQEEVFQIQMRNLENGMALVDQNRHRPDAARFRWNPEVTFTVMKWLEQAQQNEIDRFVSMVQDGYIGLDGFYAGMLTGLCRPEELAQVFFQKKNLEKLTSVAIDSAMITDIPGWNWGLVSALAENGIRYLSSGPNAGDRIGYTLKEWGDKPFYWISPSGRERVLLWVHGKGYAWFHTGLDYAGKMKNKLTPGRVRRYMRSLEHSGYPYDTVIIRYTIGADNGPADEHLSQIVEEWNTSIDDIQLNISTTSKAMAEFEREYGRQIPEYRGDFTPYWEDGACSTARETAIAREASEQLTQAQTLFALTGVEKNRQLETRAWDDVLLFNEHTWGAHNSISQPDHPFAQSQWAWKRERALEASHNTHELLSNATGGAVETTRFYMDESSSAKTDDRFTVYNPHSWTVSQIVELNSAFGQVFDMENQPAPCQRLASGRLAVYIKDLHPFSSREYCLADGEPAPMKNGCRVDRLQLNNSRVTVGIDERTGSIRSFCMDGVEHVDPKSDDTFNGYVLVPIKTPVFKQRENVTDGVRIEEVDSGPLRATIRVSRKAARTIEYASEISVDAFSNEVRINNMLNRPVSRWKEGIHFSYPFDLPDGTVRYDCAWGVAQLDVDQLTGANRNFITASRWVDVSNEKRGICCVLLDAPIFKSGVLTRDPWRWGPPELCGWKKHAAYNGTIYSYVMNNYWQTNYKADQPGWTLFRYVFKPHDRFSSAQNYRVAMENAQPLILAYGGRPAVKEVPMPSHENVVMNSLDVCDDRVQMRLTNIGSGEVETSLLLRGSEIHNSQIQVVSAGKEKNKIGNRIRLVAAETILVSINLDDQK